MNEYEGMVKWPPIEFLAFYDCHHIGRTYLSVLYFLIHAQVEGALNPLLSSSSMAAPPARARTDNDYFIKLLLIDDSGSFSFLFSTFPAFFSQKKKKLMQWDFGRIWKLILFGQCNFIGFLFCCFSYIVNAWIPGAWRRLGLDWTWSRCFEL